MATLDLTAKDRREIGAAVQRFVDDRDQFVLTGENLSRAIKADASLKKQIHSVLFRVKDPQHLRLKLSRKATDARKAGKLPEIDRDNLYEQIGDLVGVRILHLHPTQMLSIHPALIRLFKEKKYIPVEPPQAKTWDDEYRELFKRIGLEDRPNKQMYTSIHYVVEENTQAKFRCELQVRTLMEEVWGEVSHRIDYPRKTASTACKEQLLVLARLASSGIRLVDAIFASHQEYALMKRRRLASKKRVR